MDSVIETIGLDTSAVGIEVLNPLRYRRSVERFLRHFGLSKRLPDLNFLSDVLLCYSKLPYENLSKIIKHKEQIDRLDKIRLPEEVVEDYVRFRLGGTCFALTFTLETILTHLGYVCYPVLADMKWKPCSHSALIVLWQGDKYLADPGYLFNQPMQLHVQKPRIYHSTVSGVEVIFRPETSVYELFTFNKHQMKWRYRFRDLPCPRVTFLKYWLDSFYWNSMHGLLLNKVEKDRMVYVHKTFMRETTYQHKKNRNIKHDFHSAIEEVFEIDSGKIDEALAALDVNMARERAMGLWKPGIKKMDTEKQLNILTDEGGSIET